VLGSGAVRTALPLAMALSWGLFSRPSAAQRRLFEPTDLEMEKPGIAEVDLQVGALRSDVPWRLVVPDLELDLGIAEGVELDVDGAYAIEGPHDGSFSLDHPAPDNLWLAAKLGIYDWRAPGANDAYALGAQFGPKLPVATDGHGIGYEWLLLLGRTWGESHLVLNLGGLIDPGVSVSHGRPIGIEGGVDADVDLKVANLSVSGELGGIRYFSADPHELHATAGLTWAANDNLDISAVALTGFLKGGDHAGFLLGVSPKFALWK
jgi:hypothetical protein